MRGIVMVGAVVAVGLGIWGCGGSHSNGNGRNPNSPTPPSAAGVVTVNVVAINGAQSFSPNPATLPAGQMIVVRHHSRPARERIATERPKEPPRNSRGP